MRTSSMRSPLKAKRRMKQERTRTAKGSGDASTEPTCLGESLGSSKSHAATRSACASSSASAAPAPPPAPSAATPATAASPSPTAAHLVAQLS